MKKLLFMLLMTVSFYSYGQSNLSKIYRDTYLLRYCPNEQTLQHFKALKPDAYAISFCIVNAKYAQRKDMIALFKASSPTKADVTWLKQNSKFARRNY